MQNSQIAILSKKVRFSIAVYCKVNATKLLTVINIRKKLCHIEHY